MQKKSAQPLTPDSPVTALPGISETRGAAFARLGIGTLSDLIRHYPRTYENRGTVTTCADAVHGSTVSLLLTVGTQPKLTTIRRGMTILRFTAFDDTGTCVITYFNQTFLKSTFQPGCTFRFFGRAERAANRLQMTSPRAEPLPLADPGDGSSLPAMYPVYGLSAGITQKLMRDSVRRALHAVFPPDVTVPEPIPDALLRKYGLCGARYAIENIHNPPDPDAADRARRRIVFEELMRFSLGLRLRRQARICQAGPPMQAPDMTPFYAALPYALTGAQQRTVREFLSDMTGGGAPMNRLLSGDVGSGKTVCAAAALYIAVKNGYQAALMAPTEILARQHFADLEPLFAGLGFRCALLVGATKAKEKREIKAALAAGTLDLVIGTHALIEDNVVFASCGLVITDEQHRFGVGQRAALAQKAAHVHTLIMSATPIPRTLALMMFGDLDMSVLDELPPGRQKVSTFAVDSTYRTRLNGFIRKQAEAGHQTYIVCPAVDEADGDDAGDAFSGSGFSGNGVSGNGVSENGVSGDGSASEAPSRGRDMKAAVAFARELSEEVFPDLPVGFLHGKMKSAEKDAVMDAFLRREIMILVSTTVIEVGVNVPNATLMVVENAELFGLSQLHQLRGRVGRGRDKSWCILVSDAYGKSKPGDPVRERLDILCHSGNGYEIAQKDLELRGPGDFFAGNGGVYGNQYDCRQSGGLRFEAASFCDDMALLQDAFAAAAAVTEEDPSLVRPEHAVLRHAVEAAFGTVVY